MDNLNDNMIKPSFTSKRLDEEKEKDKRKVIPVSFNLEELKKLEEIKKDLKQDLTGTAIKQLMRLGAIVLQEEKTKVIQDIITTNERNVTGRRGVQF